jgi:UrcA family protein
MTALRKWIASITVATAMSVASFSSNAASVADDDAPTRTVKVWDLDLSKPADVQTLYQRVRSTAYEMCRAEVNRHRLTTRHRAPIGWAERCMTDAVDSAVRGAANPRLAEMHASAGRRVARL